MAMDLELQYATVITDDPFVRHSTRRTAVVAYSHLHASGPLRWPILSART